MTPWLAVWMALSTPHIRWADGSLHPIVMDIPGHLVVTVTGTIDRPGRLCDCWDVKHLRATPCPQYISPGTTYYPVTDMWNGHPPPDCRTSRFWKELGML